MLAVFFVIWVFEKDYSRFAASISHAMYVLKQAACLHAKQSPKNLHYRNGVQG